MADPDEATATEPTLETVGSLADSAARTLRSASPVLLEGAVALHEAYRAALTIPEAFARGSLRAEDLVERSVRAELAVAVGVSERDMARRLVHARLLVEELPRTRAALASASILWEAGEVICAALRHCPPALGRSSTSARSRPPRT